MTYVIWDWNGTLLDDSGAGCAALNRMLARRHLPQSNLAFYRAHFGFPVRPFYERLGFRLEDEDWDALAREYHAAYAAEPKGLQKQALAALREVRKRGVGQSLLSALRQDLLDRETEAFGIRPYLDYVYGTDNLDGASKLDRAKELMAAVRARATEPVDAVLIGDALHDKEVADELGARCIFFAGGSHAKNRLESVAPTAETLLEAVDLALRSR